MSFLVLIVQDSAKELIAEKEAAEKKRLLAEKKAIADAEREQAKAAKKVRPRRLDEDDAIVLSFSDFLFLRVRFLLDFSRARPITKCSRRRWSR